MSMKLVSCNRSQSSLAGTSTLRLGIARDQCSRSYKGLLEEIRTTNNQSGEKVVIRPTIFLPYCKPNKGE